MSSMKKALNAVKEKNNAAPELSHFIQRPSQSDAMLPAATKAIINDSSSTQVLVSASQSTGKRFYLQTYACGYPCHMHNCAVFQTTT
jgi:hypothetical protein